MKTHTITIDDARLQTLAGLIVAGGKSPAMPVEAMMQAAEMLQWFDMQVKISASAEKNIVPINKDATHG